MFGKMVTCIGLYYIVILYKSQPLQHNFH